MHTKRANSCIGQNKAKNPVLATLATLYWLSKSRDVLVWHELLM